MHVHFLQYSITGTFIFCLWFLDGMVAEWRVFIRIKGYLCHSYRQVRTWRPMLDLETEGCSTLGCTDHSFRKVCGWLPRGGWSSDEWRGVFVEGRSESSLCGCLRVRRWARWILNLMPPTLNHDNWHAKVFIYRPLCTRPVLFSKEYT